MAAPLLVSPANSHFGKMPLPSHPRLVIFLLALNSAPINSSRGRKAEDLSDQELGKEAASHQPVGKGERPRASVP